MSLTDRQLWMIRAALEEYLAIFSHEGDIVDEIKALLRSVANVESPVSGVDATSPPGEKVTP